MRIAVRYASRGGNTRAIAIPIAQEVHAEALSVDTPLSGRTDLLFLGGAMYAFHIGRELRDFIGSLNPSEVGTVAVFSTAANPGGASRAIEKACRKAGLNVLPIEYHCRGPQARTEDAARAAAAFAKKALAMTEQNGAAG